MGSEEFEEGGQPVDIRNGDARKVPQPEYPDALGWWKVDRPDGPGPESAIGVIIVEP